MIAVFLGGVLGIPIVAALVDRLMILSSQRRELGRVAKSASTLLGWILVGIVILASVGFPFATLIQAVLVVTGVIFALLLIYGFARDIFIGLMLVSDDDFHEGVKVEVKNSIRLVGQLREIGIIRTKVTGEDGRIYVLPNRAFQYATFLIAPGRGTD